MEALRIGKQLQLLIATAEDLSAELKPLRAQQARRNAKVAASVGAASSAMVGGAMWMANLGFWASLGAALGLASVPLVITVTGLGGLTLGLPRRRANPAAYAARRQLIELTAACFQLMAAADGQITEEERVLLRAVLLRYPLHAEDRQRIADTPPLTALAQAGELEEAARQQILRGTWMLAETDGVTPEEERLFADLAARLGLADEVRTLQRESRELQAAANDLVTAMFRCCQQVLAPQLGEQRANDFLETLAQIAATPAVRRSLRNSLRSGFSSGGAARLLEQHAQWPKLVAQARNAVRAVYEPPEALRSAGKRLLELVDATSLKRSEVRRVTADVDLLFDDALRGATAAPNHGG